MPDILDDFANSRVPEERTISGYRIGMINGVLCFAVPGLVAGVEIGGALGLERGIRAFLIGGIFLGIVGTVVGIIGVRNRVSSYLLTNFVFGRFGARAINIAMAIALLGWYGVNMDLLSATVQALSATLFSLRPSLWSIEVVSGAVMTLTAIYGFGLLQRLAGYAVPLLVGLTLYIGVKSYLAFDGNASTVVAGQPAMTDGEAVTVVTGGFIVGAVLMSDLTRFAKTDKDAAIASFLPFLGLSSIAYLSAALAAIVFQQSDILAVMLVMGLGAWALSLVFISTWITNVLNLYSCSLSLGSLFVNRKQVVLTIVAGALATGAAALNILDNYVSFLFGLSVIFAPIGGIFIVDFYWLRRMQPYPMDALHSGPTFSAVALLAWAAGTGVAFLATYDVIRLTGFEVADAMLVSSALYAAMCWLRDRQSTDRNGSSTPT